MIISDSNISWSLLDPLNRQYFWLEVTCPIVPLTLEKRKHKSTAKALAQKALSLAKQACLDKEICAVRVKREMSINKQGKIKEAYYFFKVNSQFELL